MAKAVARFVDGTEPTGYSADFDVKRQTFSLAAAPSQGAGTVAVTLADRKAVVFVGDREGDARQQPKPFFGRSQAKQIQTPSASI